MPAGVAVTRLPLFSHPLERLTGLKVWWSLFLFNMDTIQDMSVQMTQDQRNAYNKILGWYNEKPVRVDNAEDDTTPIPITSNVFVLSGAAGTGKTWLIGHIIKVIVGMSGSIAITAPTHKAKGVLAEKVGKIAVSKTIQSILGLRPNFDVETFNGKSVEFARATKPAIENFSLVVIDEASMLSKVVREDIDEQASKYGTLVLYVGDKCQLPPPGEITSSVFECVTDDRYRAELREIVRQSAQSPLSLLLSTLRYNILGAPEDYDVLQGVIETHGLVKTYGGNTKLAFSDVTRGTRELLHVNPEHGYEEGFKFIKDANEFTKLFSDSKMEPEFDRTLSYTNASVSTYNQLIRAGILGDRASEYVVRGELLMGYRIITESVLMNSGSWRTEELLMNSKEYSVFKIAKKKRKFRLDTKVMTDEQTGLALFDFRALGLDTSKWHEVEVLECTCKTGEVFNIPTNTSKNLEVFIKAQDCIIDTMNKWVGRKDWDAYFSFRNKFRLLGAPLDNTGLLAKTAKDLDYAYALTIHKSQGSTFNNVYVDVNNIRLCGNGDLALRLLYTALSRPRYKAIMLM